jgi:glucosyl-3-phosphoglycerate synthase
MSDRPRFTFAIVGHNEAQTLPAAIEQARQAADGEDRIWFVDSASTDASASVASDFGVEVIAAPIGKGRAMSQALERCRDGLICFMDADIRESSVTAPLVLKRAILETGAEVAIGSFHPVDRRRSVYTGIYRPFIGALFPEVLDEFGVTPYCGFRAWDVSLPVGRIPPGYGVETHLNLRFSLGRRRIEMVELGDLRGPLRGYAHVPVIGADIAEAILDMAEAEERLDSPMRPLWDAWAASVVELIRQQPGEGEPDDDYIRELMALAARPLPPARTTNPVVP